jgi:protoheme IX farnesyltransferase
MLMSSTLSRLEGVLPARAPGWRGVITDYYELTKPRIITLLLVTTLASMIMAARGIPPPLLTLLTLLGGALSAASAGAFNCVIDRDVDRLMQRTMLRPVATGRISMVPALTFASVLAMLSFVILYFGANPLAAWLSIAGNAYYVLIYTIWLKRATPLNIVIGGAAGSVPPLVGWAAVTHTIGGPAIALAVLIFLWTPPHFWALALMVDLQYARAKIPMLPSVRGVRRTTVEIMVYTLVMVAMSIALVPLHVMDVWYLVPALVLGGLFIRGAFRVLQNPTRPRARSLFTFSLLYLALMSLAMVGDRLIP